MRRSALTGWLLLAPSLLLLGGLVVFPILYNIWLSFFDKHAFLPVQAFVGFGHYRYFASDAELPALTRKVLGEKLTERKAIKQLIKCWRPDYQRA